jgi:hypothetical protein
MITIFDDKQFAKELHNLMQYSLGYLEGIESGKHNYLKNLSKDIIESIKQFIDVEAKANPRMLSHMYEWYENGSPNARLFEFTSVLKDSGITFESTFSQSMSVEKGSKTPFYNKAEIMEKGISVVIKPVDAEALAFKIGNEDVFVKSPIVVSNPGGLEAKGGFEKVLKEFFSSYFTQAFMHNSGIAQYLENPVQYKEGLRLGKTGGKSIGLEVGYKWISMAGAIL